MATLPSIISRFAKDSTKVVKANAAKPRGAGFSFMRRNKRGI